MTEEEQQRITNLEARVEELEYRLWFLIRKSGEHAPPHKTRKIRHYEIRPE